MPAELSKVSKSAVNFQTNKNKNLPSAKSEARQTGTHSEEQKCKTNSIIKYG